jgi:hypothetical protein
MHAETHNARTSHCLATASQTRVLRTCLPLLRRAEVTRQAPPATSHFVLDGYTERSISVATLFPSTKLPKLMDTDFDGTLRRNIVTSNRFVTDAARAEVAPKTRVAKAKSRHLSGKNSSQLSPNQQHHQTLVDTLFSGFEGRKKEAYR